MSKAYILSDEYNLLMLLNARYKYISKCKLGIVRLHETMPSLSDNKEFYISDDYNCHYVDLTIYQSITFEGIEFEHGPLYIFELLEAHREEKYVYSDLMPF